MEVAKALLAAEEQSGISNAATVRQEGEGK
jgi:hypothetical protein